MPDFKSTSLWAEIQKLKNWVLMKLAAYTIAPSSSTDNAVARWDGTAGTTLQNSSVLITDTPDCTGLNDLTLGGQLNSAAVINASGGLTITAGSGNVDIDAVGDVTIDATGTVTIEGIDYPSSDGSANQVLSTDGAGALSFVDTARGPASVTKFSIPYWNDTTGDLLGGSAAQVTAAGSIDIPSGENLQVDEILEKGLTGVSIEGTVLKDGDLTVSGDIDVDGGDILNCEDLDVNTINGVDVTKLRRTLYRDFDPINTTVESPTWHDALNWTLPADTLGAQGAVLVTLWGYHINNTSTSELIQFRVTWGGTNYITARTDSEPASAYARPFCYRLLIQNQNVTNVQMLAAELHYSQESLSLSSTLMGLGRFSGADSEGINMDSDGQTQYGSTAGPGAIDTTSDADIQIEVLMSGSTSGTQTLKVRNVHVELLP